MVVRKATKAETEALFGNGLILFVMKRPIAPEQSSGSTLSDEEHQLKLMGSMDEALERMLSSPPSTDLSEKRKDSTTE